MVAVALIVAVILALAISAMNKRPVLGILVSVGLLCLFLELERGNLAAGRWLNPFSAAYWVDAISPR